MKTIFCLIICLLPSLLSAGDAVTYKGTATGVFCSACSAKVKGALGKLDGVESIKLRHTESVGVVQVEIVSRQPVTSDLANKALGENAKMFQISDLKPAPEAKK